MKQILHTIKRDFFLLIRSPREYIYTYTYPQNECVKIKPFDPKVYHSGEVLVQKIHELYPKLKVHFIGSTVLRISGQKDIDLIINCKPKDFHLYVDGLSSLLGSPTKQHADHIE